MADMVPQGTQLNGVPHGHESADANMRGVFVSVAVLLTSVLVVMLAMAGMFTYLNNREKAKDVGVPDAFAVRQLPPGPPLLPSPKQDELPWAAYQNERRKQEATAAQYGIINKRTGAYQVPGPQLTAKEVQSETDSYFKSKPRWEQGANRYTRDSSGGTSDGMAEGSMSPEEADAQRRFGTTNTMAPDPLRPGDNRPAREIGPAQISPGDH